MMQEKARPQETIWRIKNEIQDNQSDINLYEGLLSQLYDSGWYGIQGDREIKYFLQYMGGEATIEVGSGTGRIALPLIEAGANLYGIEGSESMYRGLLSKLPATERHRFIRWDARKTPYPATDSVFKLAIIPFSTFGVLHNGLSDFGENCIMREINRLLQLDGLLIINDYRTVAFDRNKLKGPRPAWIHTHQHAEHGEIIEDQQSIYLVVPNRVIKDQVVRERTTRFIRKADDTIIEEHFERIPVWDVETFPILGQDAGFEYVRGEICDFHSDASIHHIFRKISQPSGA